MSGREEPQLAGRAGNEIDLTTCILTLNEEQNIAPAIRSAKKVSPQVVVVDSLSDDDTCALAREEGAIVWQRSFDTWASQRNWALDRICQELRSEWILELDADERITQELANEIHQTLAHTAKHSIYLVRLQLWFNGRILRHGGFNRTRLPRLYRTGSARYEDRLVNEHLQPKPGCTMGALRHPIVHEDIASWERHIAKHNAYSSLEAAARALAAEDGRAISLPSAIRLPHLRRRWLREAIWNRMPAKPVLRFLQIYVFSGGMLDRRPGLRMAVFQAWQEMCIELKYEELTRARHP